MAEEIGHGADIHARPDELRCREVAKIVEAHDRRSNGVTDPNEEARHVVWPDGVAARTEGESTKGRAPARCQLP